MKNYSDLMFHKAVAGIQKADGSYDKYQVMYQHRTQEQLSADDTASIETRESVYIGTVNPEGWPYVQHRGGPSGLIKVIGPSRIAFAD
jgi:predicted pyridoxine 5'-phosphate oxidase superfamily flavin-nucleotide-binding protein